MVQSIFRKLLLVSLLAGVAYSRKNIVDKRTVNQNLAARNAFFFTMTFYASTGCTGSVIETFSSTDGSGGDGCAGPMATAPKSMLFGGSADSGCFYPTTSDNACTTPNFGTDLASYTWVEKGGCYGLNGENFNYILGETNVNDSQCAPVPAGLNSR